MRHRWLENCTQSLDAQTIYQQHAAEYDRLVSAEDCDHALFIALDRLTHFQPGALAVDIGAGTGRVSRQLLTLGARVIALDRSAAMLKVALPHLSGQPPKAIAAQADAARLSVAAECADLTIAGWVYGHFRYWMPDGWQRSIRAAIQEMERVVKPGGLQIIIETLGTGTEVPNPPPDLREYYAWLEAQHGFERLTLRTDYLFTSVDEAAEVTGFFFGAEFAETVRRHQWLRVPECTGVWFRRKA